MAEYKLNFSADEINKRLAKIAEVLTSDEIKELFNLTIDENNNIILDFTSIDGNDVYD